MVVVSNDVANKFSPVVVVATLTRTIPTKRYPQNVSLPEGRPLKDAGTILCNQLYTLDKAVLRERCGTLDPLQVEELNRALSVTLALPMS